MARPKRRFNGTADEYAGRERERLERFDELVSGLKYSLRKGDCLGATNMLLNSAQVFGEAYSEGCGARGRKRSYVGGKLNSSEGKLHGILKSFKKVCIIPKAR
ncbi:MAG: hypothetical protein ACYC6M_05035 [Terriglobales bacterium]